MTFELSTERVSLPLKNQFTIARGSQSTAELVVVTIRKAGIEGVGAAAPSPRYGETIDDVEAVIPWLFDRLDAVTEPLPVADLDWKFREVAPEDSAARAAVSIALYDFVAKRLDVPLYHYFGLDPTDSLETSYTIGLSSPNHMAEKAASAVEAGYSILKVKLDNERVRRRMKAVREAAPAARIRVDANEAWTADEAVDHIESLETFSVEFVEQPVPATDLDALETVYSQSALPIAVDESCVTADDVPAVADYCDIVNGKLMKAGSLTETIQQIYTAHAHGLEVMLGCMIESNASIAAACHLAPLLDYADLDGALLLEQDPYLGVPMSAGTINLAAVSGTGTGVQRRTPGTD